VLAVNLLTGSPFVQSQVGERWTLRSALSLPCPVVVAAKLTASNSETPVAEINRRATRAQKSFTHATKLAMASGADAVDDLTAHVKQWIATHKASIKLVNKPEREVIHAVKPDGSTLEMLAPLESTDGPKQAVVKRRKSNAEKDGMLKKQKKK
jgi:hypothetical protein